MLVMENVIRRAASGMPLELRYPAPTAQPAQVATSRRTQEFTACRNKQRGARKAVAREWYRIEMRERPSQEESVRKKWLILPELSEEEEAEGEEEEARSDSDDTADDPGYLQDPTENVDDDDDDGGDDDDDGNDTDWLGLRQRWGLLRSLLYFCTLF
ncbi:hypothetical protein RHMOL_Rhmol09G0106000 [Rhododendron molle]|uniref:Uncharacterized protein n=1 Tax=Rhododendron molle TaxID=49168 RepID=A0ACC0MDL6_RHOML|nr:hypothetical protein RHMOL_Rhmol09G0106000 [Rhododendron molle]